jgi:hypothetical protein
MNREDREEPRRRPGRRGETTRRVVWESGRMGEWEYYICRLCFVFASEHFTY